MKFNPGSVRSWKSLFLSMVVLGFSFSGLLAGVAKAQSNPTSVVIDLKAGTTTSLGSTALISGGNSNGGNGCGVPIIVAFNGNSPTNAAFKMALATIDLCGFTQVNVVVEYEGLPGGWTVNLGDSPTNDGFAGDANSTDGNNAELWILNQGLFVANAGKTPGDIDNPLLRQDLTLTDGAVRFVVKNQFLSWGGPYGFIQTPNTKKLFAIPDTANTMAGDGSKVYLGLNQVVSGRFDRTGAGARRVLITLQ